MGDFSAWLTSPFGTRNELFFNDRAMPEADWELRRDYHDDELDWQFVSNAYWGEDVEGTWILELYNDTGNDLTGTLQDYEFTAAMGELLLVPEPSAYAFLMALAVIPVLLSRRRQ
ncbi:proprotein convertase P-domain-containing protein [Puniceicoccus vermicola]|uniref:proprotein convertase P-domain-containing protein n=1 Tax=Puniceicoccus vermicola TaxID=388746 RepID=UPI0033915E59